MKKKALCLIFTTTLAGVINVAGAEEPLILNAHQMDQVTAGQSFEITGSVIDFEDRWTGVFAELRSGRALKVFGEVSSKISIDIPRISLNGICFTKNCN